MSASAPTLLEENAGPVRSGVSDTDGPPTPDGGPTAAPGPARAAGKADAHRFHELDVLRFLAAAAVVAFHYCFRAGAGDNVMAATGFSDPHGIFRYGYLGVDLFFVISGFVILNSAWNKPASAFVASRIARLYPAFWVACTITALVCLIDPNERFPVTASDYLVNMTMAPDLFDIHKIDGVYWTLLIELKFYVLVLALCLIGMTTNRIVALAVGWLAVSMWDSGVAPLPSALDTLLEPKWSAYFVVGIFFALIAREGWRPRYVAPLLVACGWALHLAVDFAGAQSRSYHSNLSPYVVAALICGIFAVFALIASHRLRTRWAARVAFLGTLTYPLYLVHQNIGFVIFNNGQGRISRWALLAIVLTVVLALAWALHVLVERRFGAPFQRWLRGRLARLKVAGVGEQPVEEAQGFRRAVVGLAPTSGGPGRLF